MDYNGFVGAVPICIGLHLSIEVSVAASWVLAGNHGCILVGTVFLPAYIPRSTLRLEYQPEVIRTRQKPEFKNEARGKNSSPRAKIQLTQRRGQVKDCHQDELDGVDFRELRELSFR